MIRTRIKQQPPRISIPTVEQSRRVKETEPFYKTPAWRRFAKNVVRKRGKICQLCGVGVSKRVFVDHVIELKDGGAPFDEDNVQVLCGSCHTWKTLQVRMERMLT
jgi:5-methylcytosine-specific restriction enzyme A